MYKPKDTKEKILHRLKITRGHLNKVISMVEKDTYCIDVMHQINALKKALEQTGNEVLENHLKTCVADAIGKGKKEETIAEVMEVFKRRTA